MKVILLGGTGTVTGSKFLVETRQARILVDCGLYQGYKWLRRRNWHTFPVEPSSLDAVVLTHAHIDHSGYVPVLYKAGFRGPIYAHTATEGLCAVLLADSGRLQEEDAKYYADNNLSKHEKPEPLYDAETAEASMELFRTLEFGESVTIRDLDFHLQPAGHILGAGSLILNAEGKRLGFSGDVGQPNDVMMYPPRPLPGLDLLFLESTYGDRRHPQIDPFKQLAKIVTDTVAKGGVLLIPSFAVGRAQILQYMLVKLMDEGRIPELPIYLDSPMAIDVSQIYNRYSDEHRLSTKQLKRISDKVTYARRPEESKALMGLREPHVIIAGSGMATGGRILHHFKKRIDEPSTTVLFTGHQVAGTRGAKMVDGAEQIKVHGEWLPVQAEVKVLEGISGHGDYVDLVNWLESSAIDEHTEIQLVHGEPEALEAMRDYVRRETRYQVDVGDYQSIVHL